MSGAYLVTGAAGFIGSNLTEALLAQGHRVIGVDAVTNYYDQEQKRENLARLEPHPHFTLRQEDLASADLTALLADAAVVCHLAGQPGVRSSWGDDFRDYVRHNVLATQRLLEACRAAPVQRFVFASSSSVYGNAPVFPTREESPVHPRSPYGVTKLTCEFLIRTYADVLQVPAVALRYFTVYGPRQRPDMAIHRLIRSATGGEPFHMYGDGSQVRDFTFVSDVVDATVRATVADVPTGTAINVAGGSSTSMRDLLGLVAAEVGSPPRVVQHPAQVGDVQRTGASTDLARLVLGWQPRVSLPEGLARQVAWHRAAGASRAPQLATLRGD